MRGESVVEDLIISEIPDAIREGEMVLVPVGRGAFMRLFKSDAIKRGLLPPEPEEKKKPSLPNKKRGPLANKGG